MPEYALLNTDGTIRRFKESPTKPPDLVKQGGTMRWVRVTRDSPAWHQKIQPPSQPVASNASSISFSAVSRTSAEILQDIRQRRTRLLRESDWTRIDDAALTSAKRLEWSNYRQALRDLPQTYDGNLINVVWPQEP